MERKRTAADLLRSQTHPKQQNERRVTQVQTYHQLRRKLAPDFYANVGMDMDAADAMEDISMFPLYLPIVSTSRLWLPKLGIGDDERFAVIFRNTWKKIPLWARRMMVKHWRTCPQFLRPGFWSPAISMAKDWAISDRVVRQPRDCAACGRCGHCLFFYAPVVDAMPVQHVEELIAHELAHVVQDASGDCSQTDRSEPRWNDPCEEIADEIMNDWGFDPWAMDEWFKAHWKWNE